MMPLAVHIAACCTISIPVCGSANDTVDIVGIILDAKVIIHGICKSRYDADTRLNLG